MNSNAIRAATAILLAALVGRVASAWQDCGIELVSRSSTGQHADAGSAAPTLSMDGRFVAFGGSATNLVPGDVNQLPDSFVFDRATGTIEMVSVATSGAQGDGRSVGPELSADGNVVAFASEAANFDPRDTDHVLDVYVRDRQAQTTTLVSERLGSGPSAQGCYGVSISADGRFVAFDCIDDNVVPGDTNGKSDVFVRDLVTQTTERVSVGPAGEQSARHSRQPSISADGRFVAFVSAAGNWFPSAPLYSSAVFVRDRQAGTTIPVTLLSSGVLSPGTCEDPSISSDGRYVAFSTNSRFLAPDQPFFADILRWDRLTGEIVNACVPVQGGRPDYPSNRPMLSADGRYLTFETLASNLTVQPGPPPMVIWKDMETGATVVVNEDPQGEPANNWGSQQAISGDGRSVAFVSKATNLVPGASGLVYHVYVRTCDVASPSTYCKPAKPPGGCVGRMSFQGAPSATAGSGFEVRAQGLEANRVGLLLYGRGGPWGQRVTPGFLCVQAPIVRAHVAPSGGTSGCDGVLSMDFNAWIASGVDPALVAGQTAYVQAWFRNSASGSQLSDALAFQIGP
jgi:Tol biopolymer transport system component